MGDASCPLGALAVGMLYQNEGKWAAQGGYISRFWAYWQTSGFSGGL